MKHTIMTDGRLKISVTPEEQELLREQKRENSIASDGNVAFTAQDEEDFLEPLIANSELEWLPEGASRGDLTSAPMLGILGDETVKDSGWDEDEPCFGFVPSGQENGAEFVRPIVSRWAYMSYQIRSFLSDLCDDGECIWEGGHAASGAVAKMLGQLDDDHDDGDDLRLERIGRFPKADWKYEVANGDTLLGYEEWVRHRKEAEAPPANFDHDPRFDEGGEFHEEANPSSDREILVARDCIKQAREAADRAAKLVADGISGETVALELGRAVGLLRSALAAPSLPKLDLRRIHMALNDAADTASNVASSFFDNQDGPHDDLMRIAAGCDRCSEILRPHVDAGMVEEVSK